MKKLIIIGLIAAILTLCFFSSCCQKEALTISVTRLSPTYQDWLLKADSTLIIKNLYGISPDSALSVLMRSDGLLITGGEDIFPALYGREPDTIHSDGYDPYRDSLELACLSKSFEAGIPVFGICRGFQIINVHQGGSLIVDLPTELGTDVAHRCPDPMKCLHPVKTEPKSHLRHITGLNEGMVNSNHHQGIDRLASTLTGVCFSADQLIEGIEWKEKSGKSFLMAVQWHPERLIENPGFSEPLALEFIKEAKNFQAKKP